MSASFPAARADRADWARLIVATLARVLLLSVMGGVLWSAVPTLWGWRATTVMSDSMTPRIGAGDVVVTMPLSAQDIQLGHVVLVHNPAQAGELLLHRYVGITPSGDFITRGDANAADDSTPVPRDQVIGVGFLRTPYVGLPLVWASRGDWGWVAAAGCGVLALVLLASTDAHLRRRTLDDGRPRWRLRRRGSIALAAGATAGILTLVLGAGAHAAFAATASNLGNTLNASASYPCLSPSPGNSPYLYYAYTETSGTTAVDSSGNGRSGTLQSGVSRGSSGCDSYATFNGTTTGQVVTAASSVAAPASFTIAAWFKTTTSGGELLGFGNSASGASTAADRQLFLDNAGHLNFSVVPLLGITTITSPSTYLDGSWHLAVATMDGTLLTGTGMKLYVDGVQVAANGTNLGALQLFGYWRIGYDNLGVLGSSAPTRSAFTGSMDDTAVYTSTLSAAQVAALYSAGRL